MNAYLKIIILLSVTITFFSCGDEFINEKIGISGVGTFAIIISPDWDASDYQFKCKGVGNSDFTIDSKPEWLVLDSNSGKFKDSIATIHGFANKEARFSKIGFYTDQMLITASGKKYAIPLYYIIEGNPSIKVNRSFELKNDYQLQISNLGDGILFWDIVSMPSWLTVNMSQFNPMSVILGKGGFATLPFSFNIQNVVQNNLKGTIVLRTNDKNNPLVEIAVAAYTGTPNLLFLKEHLDFGSSETTMTVHLANMGEGILIWNFEGLPEWLSVSTANGLTVPHNGIDIIFTCNRDNLKPGLNSTIFNLKSNDLNKSSVAIKVSVRIPGVSENIKELEGNIIDATIDKKTNTLYYATEQPNKLVAYDIVSKSVLREIALSKAPTCLAISEDFKKATVGHEGMISAVDLTSNLVSKTYELNTKVYDMEWAEDGWFCYSKTNSTSPYLFWINTNTNETYETPTGQNLGTADLKKVPHKPYIIGSRKNIFPNGIFVFDIEKKTQKSYTHETIGDMWFFKEGELLVSEYSGILRSSEIIAANGGYQLSGPSVIGELKYNSQYHAPSWWIDYSEAKQCIWAIFSNSTQMYLPPENGTIYQFDDNNYTLVKTYPYDRMYQPDAQNAAYEVESRYVFSNSAGTELSVLRKGKDNNIWTVEFIQLQ